MIEYVLGGLYVFKWIRMFRCVRGFVYVLVGLGYTMKDVLGFIIVCWFLYVCDRVCGI